MGIYFPWGNIMTDNRQNYILRTSGEVFNKLSINNNDSLILEEIKLGEVVSKSSIIDNIKNYSAAIDKEDKIHIVYTDDNINLNYIVLSEKENVVHISRVKHNLILGCMSIKILDLKPHIIFTVIDVKQNKHSINHGYLEGGFWNTEEIFEATGPKYIQPYSLELYNNEIYIMLYLKYSEGKAALFRLEDSTNQWVDIDRNIDLEDSINQSFFISPSNVAIITYNKLINKSIQTIVMYRNLMTKLYESWKGSVISDEDTNTLKPSVFFREEYYYITWLQGSKMVLKRSKELIDWEDALIFDKYSDKYIKCTYMSNNSEDSDLKTNSIYFSNTKDSIPSIHLHYKQKVLKEYVALDSGQSNVSYLEEHFQLLDKELEKKTHENNLMKDNINDLQNVIEEYEAYIDILSSVETSSVKDINFNESNFLNEIIALIKEEGIQLQSYKESMLKMYAMLQYKDKIIEELMSLKTT
jgi:hypothetical protein